MPANRHHGAAMHFANYDAKLGDRAREVATFRHQQSTVLLPPATGVQF
jgi:hypothetical protein